MSHEALSPSPEAEAILRAAGWSPDEQADVSGWVDMLRSDGNDVSPHAEAILRAFGGIRLKHKGFGGRSHQDFHVDPTSWYHERDRIQDIEKVVGHNVCPLGEAMGAALLAVLDDGSIISEFEGSVVLLGVSWRSALDYLVLNKGTTKWLVKDYEPVN